MKELLTLCRCARVINTRTQQVRIDNLDPWYTSTQLQCNHSSMFMSRNCVSSIVPSLSPCTCKFESSAMVSLLSSIAQNHSVVNRWKSKPFSKVSCRGILLCPWAFGDGALEFANLKSSAFESSSWAQFEIGHTDSRLVMRLVAFSRKNNNNSLAIVNRLNVRKYRTCSGLLDQALHYYRKGPLQKVQCQ